MRVVRQAVVVLGCVLFEALSGGAAAQTNIVTFTDTNLQMAVCAALGKTNGAVITGSDMLTLTQLSACRANITDLTGSGWAWATNLQYLDLAGNSVSDLSPLAGLVNLANLWLYGNRIGDLNALTKFTRLTNFNAGDNLIFNVTPLKQLTNLASLWLYGNSITNLSEISNLKGLGSLFLYNCGLQDITALSPLTNLSYLELRSNPHLTNAASVLTNVTHLKTLYLGGTSISDVSFLLNLTQLTLLDLDRNAISNFSALAALPGLKGLDLSYNPLADVAQVTNFVNLTELCLSGNSISNVAVFTNLSGLVSLTLYSNRVSDLSPLTRLTNLHNLGLSWNPVTNYGSLTNLIELWLDGNSIGNTLVLTNVLRGLTSLKALDLSHNRLDDIGVSSGLTNLLAFYADCNGLTGIAALTNLPHLLRTQIRTNLPDVSTNSSTLGVITNLQGRGVEVGYLPTNQPPGISVASSLPPGIWVAESQTWVIATNTTSALRFDVYDSDDVTPSSQLLVTASCSNTNLLLNPGVTGTASLRTLMVATTNLTGTATINLKVTEPVTGDRELSTTAVVAVTVMALQPVNIPDTNLMKVITNSLGKATTNLTSLDLLGLTTLVASGTQIANLSGLAWARNLAVLFLDRNAISNLAPLRNLSGLAILSLGSNLVTDVSSLARLTNLTYLDLSRNPVTNCAALSGLSNLTALNLSADSVTDLNFLTNLTHLNTLDLSSNRISDISRLSSLTNLSMLYLGQNRLTSIAPLPSLPILSYVDLRLNVLNCSTIEILQSNGVAVDCSPQRTPPTIDVRTNWLIPRNTNCALSFSISDTGPLDEWLGVGKGAANADLALGLTNLTGQGNNANWTLLVTNQITTNALRWITLSATNDVGLNANTMILAQVASLVPLTGQWFGDTNLTWTNYGNAPWFGQGIISNGSYPAGQSGAIGNNGSSWLQTTVVGPGMLTFWWKVSSESNFDWLQFSVDGYTNRISGEVDWRRQIANVPPGVQTLDWRYYKDDGVSSGWDAAWLAHVTFVPGIWLEMADGRTNNQCNLLLHAIPGNLYEILVSSNFANWSTLAAVVPTNTAMGFLDASAAPGARFYRLRSLSPASIWLESQGPTNRPFRFVLHSPSNLPFALQASTSFTNWITLTTLTNSLGAAVYTDTLSTGFPSRFYRSLLLHY